MEDWLVTHRIGTDLSDKCYDESKSSMNYVRYKSSKRYWEETHGTLLVNIGNQSVDKKRETITFSMLDLEREASIPFVEWCSTGWLTYRFHFLFMS